MDRRAFIATAAGLLAAPLAAEAQPTDGMVRIGFLAVGPSPLLENFREELRTSTSS
jgi:hypothetical protein